jgi:hypothetical protein
MTQEKPFEGRRPAGQRPDAGLVHAAEHLIKGGAFHLAPHQRSGDGQLMHTRHLLERDRRSELGLD